MTWVDALKIGLVVIGSLGGGGSIVLALSRFIGDKWLQEWRGDIDERLRRLDARLKHRNYVLQRIAEFELVALAECWHAARASLLSTQRDRTTVERMRSSCLRTRGASAMRTTS